MNRTIFLGACLTALAALVMPTAMMSQSANSRVFLYSPGEKEGMHVAMGDPLKEVGRIFESDYSQWGSQKRMFSPFVVRLQDGAYAAVFQVNESSPCFAVAYSEDLKTWRPQDYPKMSTKGCLAPVIKSMGGGRYAVLFKDKEGKARQTLTDSLFRHFSPDEAASLTEYEAIARQRDSLEIGGKQMTGNLLECPAEMQKALTDHLSEQARLAELWQERLTDDTLRFSSLIEAKTLKAKLHIKGSERKAISDKLIGIFFEDINFAADGGLYAELIQNRDFEYTAMDHKGWDASTAWTLEGGGTIEIGTDEPLSKANPHYAVMSGGQVLINSGWDGIPLKKGEAYDLSLRINHLDGKAAKLTISLKDGDKLMAQTLLKTKAATGWQQYDATLTALDDADAAVLVIETEAKGRIGLDMISLFPQATFRGRKNGLRKDLAEALEALHPKFVRFPGGCMSHGQGLDNIYHWQHSIGKLEDRLPDFNIWHCHQTRGLGFFEYFQFCEDIGAEPLPVLASGVPCQNSAPNAEGYGGQQGGIAMEDMPAYIEELCALIEWANADPETSSWARMRAEAGHPEPFNLKYIGIGNEDIISTTFEDRNLMICQAIKDRYPEIKIVGTVGPFHYPSSDYIEGWKFANDHKDILYMVDEHYYESVGWFINNQDYYDNYDRSAPKVYLGEYAAKSRRGEIDPALAEALYLCSIERNADVVEMTSYAPLLCNDKHHNWDPDMIYFNHKRVDLTPSYETQRLFSTHSGDQYIKSELSLETAASGDTSKRVAASVVYDSKTGKTYLKLVNVLPVSLDLTITADNLLLKADRPTEGFSGKPGQRRVATKQGLSGQLSGEVLTLTLEPYSFQVVEL